MGNLLALFSQHRVKIIGGLMTFIGFVQGYPGLAKLMTPHHFAWFMVWLGLGSAVFGFFRKQPGSFFNSWKTVILGSATTVISFFQAVPQLPSLVPGFYEELAFALGIATTFMGIVNTLQAKAEDVKNGGSTT